jgi:hypothetical protein
VKAVWRKQKLFEPSQLESLRHTAWNMFDHGFSSYMKHAFPMVRDMERRVWTLTY